MSLLIGNITKLVYTESKKLCLSSKNRGAILEPFFSDQKSCKITKLPQIVWPMNSVQPHFTIGEEIRAKYFGNNNSKTKQLQTYVYMNVFLILALELPPEIIY